MVTPTQSARRLLVIDDDDDLRLFLQDLLSEEGYLVDTSATIGEALAAIESHVYHLVVTDLLAHSATDPLRSAKILCDAASPTPVMALTGWSITAEEVIQAGLIRLAPKPFDIVDLLNSIAECASAPLTPDQQRWAAIVHDYCAAINAHDPNAVMALCADNVRLYAVAEAAQDQAIAVTGRASFRAHLDRSWTEAPDMRFDDYLIYPQQNGVALRGMKSWQASQTTDERKHVAMSMTYQFAHHLISQVTIRATEWRWMSLQTQSASTRVDGDASVE